MNTTEINYEVKLTQILDKYKTPENSLSQNNNSEVENKPIGQCNTLNSLNYCLEMHKVRKNQKADFDIHSINKYNIEDEDIDKMDIVLGWKDLDNKTKEELLENYINVLEKNYVSLSKNYIKDFVIKNKTKIKYNKKEKKIDDILGMCYLNNELIIKKKKQNSNVTIDKLRKSIKK